MPQIYVLKCEDEKYYIGKTERPIEERVDEHFTKFGSAWTRKYRPLSIVESFKGDTFDEDKYTKKYMQSYGIDNVRGGSYSSVHLSDVQREALETELETVNDACYTCGKSGHFANTCNIKPTETHNIKSAKTHKQSVTCYRCHKFGHYANECYSDISYDNEDSDESYESYEDNEDSDDESYY